MRCLLFGLNFTMMLPLKCNNLLLSIVRILLLLLTANTYFYMDVFRYILVFRYIYVKTSMV
jgi:hypothetical protein